MDFPKKPTDEPSPLPRASSGKAATIGWGALLAGANGVRSLALAGGVALHAINVYLATTILPSVVQDIGGLGLYAWNTTIFVVASILGSALSAKLLQLCGPRAAYVIAATTFAAGSILCALAPTMPVMLIGRSVQGLGGGFLFALAYAMIRVVFDEALWPRAMALVSGMWGVATLIGPAVGGVFAELGVWRVAFWSVAPITVLFALLAVFVLPGRDKGPPQHSSVPLTQLSLLTAAVLAISAGSASVDLTRNIAGIVVALVLAGLLITAEGRSRNKLLPSDAIRPASTIAALYITMSLLVLTVTSGEVFVPLFLQVLHSQSPLVAGYLAALMAAGWTLGSIASSGARDRGVQRAIMIGPALGLIGMVGLCVLLPRDSDGNWWALAPICLALVAIGLGVGIAWPHLLTRVLKVAPPDEQELAGASITTIQLFATAIGAALAGMVANAAGLIDPGGIAGTAAAARWLFGIFALAPLLCLASAKRTSTNE
ncbi:MFS transporter [Rhizobium sp. P38BS-XIX]|uniref:MFS transporter n=1 Tax=Rhizobium sp. P38BS-XIX TaxID=2726740 RepID=UPI0014564ECF|nr:MFS transporter [Rhizobium sp. P38BS-XIX]NLR97570.1 MFS transporter [Rhizobium sp. P38BS-XIX]